MSRMAALELKVPPLAVLLAAAAAMALAARLTPALTATFAAQGALAWALAAAGVAVALAGIAAFRRARTTVHPMHPENASALVATGIYRRSRNPMYLGMLLLLAAWSVLLGNALALAGLPAFVAYIDRFQIRPEERALRARFGAGFDAYARSVRRWL
jgi:protein-S-isoprenylcysteine O-methyltransferase Ste14